MKKEKAPTYQPEEIQEALQGQRVRVYYNLRDGMWSIQNTKGIVIGYTTEIYLENVTFHVSEKRRQEVIRTKQKNVHAKVHGIVTAPSKINHLYNPYMYEATYNPYKYSSFVDKLAEEKLDKADRVQMINKKVFYS